MNYPTEKAIIAPQSIAVQGLSIQGGTEYEAEGLFSKFVGSFSNVSTNPEAWRMNLHSHSTPELLIFATIAKN